MVTTNHRVKLTLACGGGEVTPKLIENRRTRRGALAGVARAHTGSFLILVVAGVSGNKIHHGLANLGTLHAYFGENLVCHAFGGAHHAQQDMFGADITVVKLNGLAHGKFEDLLGARGEGNVTAWRLGAGAHNALHLFAHGIQGNPEGLKSTGTDALALVNQPEQQMLGADVIVVEHACFFLGKHHNAPSSVGKAFKHCALLGNFA